MAKKPGQPVDAASWVARGNEHYQHDEFGHALECYNRAVRLSPDSAAAQYGRGIALHALERYRGALTAYNRALKLAPDDARVHAGRARAARTRPA
jgi:Flp pilus assembly protein TadD